MGVAMLKSVCRIGVVALALVALFAATGLSASASSSSCSFKLKKSGSNAAKFSVSCNFDIKKVHGQANEPGKVNGCTANSNTSFTCKVHKTTKSYSATYRTTDKVCNPALQIKFGINGGTVKKPKIANGCSHSTY
jgi:hypothetical protein